jgi:hypothetical protein
MIWFECTRKFQVVLIVVFVPVVQFKDDVQKQPVFRPYRTNRNYQHLFFHVEAGADAPALGPGSILKGLAGFFSTHPPLEKRLANIDKVAAEIVDLERRLT